MAWIRWIAVLLVALGWSLGGADRASAEATKAAAKGSARGDHAEIRVNINEASKADLMTLAGVGANTAERIIAYRQSRGPFKRPQDLEKVEGVGKGVLERNHGRIAVK